jgi:predicted nucleic acid-binding protein
MYLLDTDILIDIQRGHTPAIADLAMRSFPKVTTVTAFKELIQPVMGLPITF